MLSRFEIWEELGGDAIASDDARHRKSNVLHALDLGGHGRHRQHNLLVLPDRTDDAGQASAMP